jgi:hypothetical protein
MELKDFNLVVESLFKKRTELEEKEKSLKELSKEVEALKFKVLQILEESGLEKHEIPGMGSVTAADRFSIAHPKEQSEKMAFFKYLKDKDILWEMVSVNSQTLNAWYKKEMDAAIERGDVDFKIPGIGEPNYIKILQMRKK